MRLARSLAPRTKEPMSKVPTFSAQEVAVPIGLLAIVGCMLVPLPPALLDVLLCSNLLFALLLVIGALHIKDPLRLATLPSLLLMATLVRLSLNLATTRAVLGSGHAGKAVEAFGSVVIQGNFVVGFVLFLLITVIQFIVVAKGAERVAEVSARFTLDALPGKQMAIDAEIRSGLLDPESARRKRAEVQTESRFYGALDGAMKFVKGDAIAGLIITFVNIAGGLLVGLMIHELDFDVAVKRYTLLTIGDGLLSQIPSLLNSVAAGLVVTRVQVDESSSLSRDLIVQLAQFRGARSFVAVASAVLGCIPGMPHTALFFVSLLIGASLFRKTKVVAPQETSALQHFEPTLSASIHIEISKRWLSRLPSLSKISDELEALRSYAFSKWGLVLQRPGISAWEPSQGTFRIMVRGMEVFVEERDGEVVEWSDLGRVAREMIDLYKAELIDDGSTRRALDYVEKNIPDLVSGVIPAVISLTQLTSVLRTLLREDVTTRHMDIILQTVAENGSKLGERALVAEVRAALAPIICDSVARDRKIFGVQLEPLLDVVLSRAEESGTLVSGDVVDAICTRVREVVEPGLILVASKRSRAYLRDIVRIRWGGIPVIAHEELVPRYEFVPSGFIELADEGQRKAVLSAAM